MGWDLINLSPPPPTNCRALVLKCWRQKPAERPHFSQLQAALGEYMHLMLAAAGLSGTAPSSVESALNSAATVVWNIAREMHLVHGLTVAELRDIRDGLIAENHDYKYALPAAGEDLLKAVEGVQQLREHQLENRLRVYIPIYN